MIEEIKEEDIINEDNEIIDFEKIKKAIDSDLAKSVCKILIESFNNGIPVIITASGFFCNYSSKHIKFLMTNNHVLNQEFLDNEENLNYIIEENGNQEKKQLNLKLNRYKFTDKELDFTIIEIRKEDNILNFVDIDENINLNIDEKDYLFSLNYTKGEQLKYSHGTYLKKTNKYFIYTIGTNHGASGAPIFLLSNSKIIGLHKGSLKNNSSEKLNLGIPIHLIISKLNNLINNFFVIKENNKEIKLCFNFGGRIIYLKFSSLTSILRVKEKIRITENIEDCTLIYNDIILNNDKDIFDYDIKDNSIIFMFPKKKSLSIDPKQKMKIYFKANGKQWILEDIYPSDKILKIKEINQRKEKIQPDLYQYIYNNQELKEDKTLADYNIMNESIIHIIGKQLLLPLFNL